MLSESRIDAGYTDFTDFGGSCVFNAFGETLNLILLFVFDQLDFKGSGILPKVGFHLRSTQPT